MNINCNLQFKEEYGLKDTLFCENLQRALASCMRPLFSFHKAMGQGTINVDGEVGDIQKSLQYLLDRTMNATGLKIFLASVVI
jgi:hypothetical protein